MQKCQSLWFLFPFSWVICKYFPGCALAIIHFHEAETFSCEANQVPIAPGQSLLYQNHIFPGVGIFYSDFALLNRIST